MFIPYLIAGSSILIGYALGHYTEEECRQGTIFFHLLCLLSTLFLISTCLFLFPLPALPLFIWSSLHVVAPYIYYDIDVFFLSSSDCCEY